MVTIYKLNGVEVFLRLKNEEYEVRLFEDNKQGHLIRAPERKGLGAVLDMAYSEIQERIRKPLHSIETKGAYFSWNHGQTHVDKDHISRIAELKTCACNGTGKIEGILGTYSHCKCRLGKN